MIRLSVEISQCLISLRNRPRNQVDRRYSKIKYLRIFRRRRSRQMFAGLIQELGSTLWY